MDYRVDIENEYKKAKSTFLRQSLLFSLILTLVLIGDVLLFTLSGENYVPNLIIAAVITTLFSWYAIFFFTNIYGEINSRYRFYKGYESGLKPVEEVEFLSQRDEILYVNGLYVYELSVRYFEGITHQDKIIYCFDKVGFEAGDKLTIETYQRIIIKADKHS